MYDMKKSLLAMAAISFLLLAGCEKSNVAPTKNSTSIKSNAVNATSKTKDTIWLAKPAITPAISKDTIWIK
ncbi:hypothetical protein LX99_03764 [Mucilaginibacter oryzae]|uniref:Uncharacterized protein n=2 Tax=Mucilaginibacter oryzae TaxID=468058 RepID=A0A316H5T3_9SPHI|nr:hypothetical protein LX99_03764 [Mucilaginibacter oryzae]